MLINSIYLKITGNKLLFYNIKKKIETFIHKKKFYNPMLFYSRNYIIFYKKKNFLIYNVFLKFKKNFLSLLYNFNNKIFLINKCGIVHRIDFNTSGIVIIANNNFFYYYLKYIFKNRKIKKYYLVSFFSTKKIKKKFRIIGFLFKKNIYSKKKENFKYSISLFKFLYNFKNSYVFICKILTGRKNQIKIHLNYYLKINFNNIILNFWKVIFYYKNKKTYYSAIDSRIIKIFRNKNEKKNINN